MLDKAIKLALNKKSDKYSLCAIITDKKGSILSIGWNSYKKSHPKQAYYAEKAGSKYIGGGLFGTSMEQWGYWYGSPKWAWLRLPGGKALIFHYFSGYFLFVLTMVGISFISVDGKGYRTFELVPDDNLSLQ